MQIGETVVLKVFIISSLKFYAVKLSVHRVGHPVSFSQIIWFNKWGG
jgi:hypothetical protein